MEDNSRVGDYRVLKQLGEGSMGTVWLAEHTTIDRRVAIKLLYPTFTAQPEVVGRFLDEARAVTGVSDPGLVQIFDFGQGVDGGLYLVMELLEGEPLDVRMARLGRLPVSEALRIMCQVSASLGILHQRDILVRRLTPEDILLVPDPLAPGGERTKVLHFGIAKLARRNDEGGGHFMLGDPSFVSPEQLHGSRRDDARTDVYALGCVLFALLAGRPPFVAKTYIEIANMHWSESPPQLSVFTANIPPELEAAVARCLSKDPAQRFASGAELAAELHRLLGASAHTVESAATTTPSSRVSVFPSHLRREGEAAADAHIENAARLGWVDRWRAWWRAKWLQG